MILTDPLGWFTLEVPEGWGVEYEDSVTVLRSPSGAAVVYVSGARHAGGRQRSFGGADFLARFLGTIGVEVDEAAIASRQGCGCRIYSYAHPREEMSWTYWSVTDDETALLIAYAGTPSGAGGERDEADEMVMSVRLYPSVPVH